MKKDTNENYRHLLDRISETYETGRRDAAGAVNRQMVETYWNVGRNIVEFEQGGTARAEYGRALMSLPGIKIPRL